MVSRITSAFSQSPSGGLPVSTAKEGAKPNLSQMGTHRLSGLEEARAST